MQNIIKMLCALCLCINAGTCAVIGIALLFAAQTFLECIGCAVLSVIFILSANGYVFLADYIIKRRKIW